MGTTFNPVVQELDDDVNELDKNKYWLQIAKSVSTPGKKASFNIVYAARHLSPSMSVSWITNYGLNWTLDVPAPGVKVQASGRWQACELGKSYDLSGGGVWNPNNDNKWEDKDCLNVGCNNYDLAVNIVVGVQDPSTKNWAPIWIGTDKLLKGAHGSYQPLETIRLWFQEKDQSTSMISGEATPEKTHTMAKDQLTHYFSWNTKDGKWLDQEKPFFQ